jgi:hypothetical protein
MPLLDGCEKRFGISFSILPGTAWMVCSLQLGPDCFFVLVLMSDRWHIFTAVGSYIAVVVVDLITSEDEIVSDPTQRLAWPIPFVAHCMAQSPGIVKEKAA